MGITFSGSGHPLSLFPSNTDFYYLSLLVRALRLVSLVGQSYVTVKPKSRKFALLAIIDRETIL